MTAPRGTEPLTEAHNGRTTYVLPLPGHKPPKALSPNGSHGNYRATAGERRRMKAAVVTRIRQLRIPPGREHLEVTLCYVPKDRRRRDPDNLMPVLKPCLDAFTPAKGGAGVIGDDTPEWITWHPPRILDPDPLRPRLWLEVTDWTGHGTPIA